MLRLLLGLADQVLTLQLNITDQRTDHRALCFWVTNNIVLCCCFGDFQGFIVEER